MNDDRWTRGFIQGLLVFVVAACAFAFCSKIGYAVYFSSYCALASASIVGGMMFVEEKSQSTFATLLSGAVLLFFALVGLFLML
jgi:glucose uptake protein GlcU